MKSSQRRVIQTTLGAGEAIKEKQDAPWFIDYPEGASVFYGTVSEMRRHLKELLGDGLLGIYPLEKEVK